MPESLQGENQLAPISPLGPDRTVEQMLVRALRALIVEGKLTPGASLPYRDLARQFNVSVTPVRIALRELAKEGIVEFRPHGGMRVVSLSLGEIEEVFAMRVGIESWLARLGAERLSDADVLAMSAHFADLERAVASHDRELYLTAGWEYRTVCYGAARRERLLDQVSLLFRRTMRYNKLALFPQERLDDSFAFMCDLRDACAAANGLAAQQAIRSLLDRSLEHLVNNLPDLVARYGEDVKA